MCVCVFVCFLFVFLCVFVPVFVFLFVCPSTGPPCILNTFSDQRPVVASTRWGFGSLGEPSLEKELPKHFAEGRGLSGLAEWSSTGEHERGGFVQEPGGCLS